MLTTHAVATSASDAARAVAMDAGPYGACSAAAFSISSAYDAASGVAAGPALLAAIKDDLDALTQGSLNPSQLARAPLWNTDAHIPPARIGGAWIGMSQGLKKLGDGWGVWTDWYDDVLVGIADGPPQSKSWAMAFTDILDPLPWDDLAAAVNAEVARRLKEPADPDQAEQNRPSYRAVTAATLSTLAEVASPQPSLTKGQLDAGPNPTYDLPGQDDDLPTLPVRQRRLIAVIVSDLPRNAPKHLQECLEGYADELKVRGVQPILGLLKDMADIVAAAVMAPTAEDEWLEPGLRKAFSIFAENHLLFLRHFPLDPKREEVFARIYLDEGSAVGDQLTAPFEKMAEVSSEALRGGLTTADFCEVVDKMTELARVLATQPPPSAQPNRTKATQQSGTDFHVDPSDRIPMVTVKKRSILTMLGFAERAYNLLGSSASIASLPLGERVLTSLKSVIDSLSAFLR